ncbi:MAG: hypothetical protein AAGI06_08110 [Pseudomonadota bacterium]
MVRSFWISVLAAACVSVSVSSVDASGRITLLQVLQAIEEAPGNPSAQAMLGTYVKAAIEGAVAAGEQSGAPVICAKPGRGRFDALEFKAFALKRKPTKAAQARAPATPVLIKFVMQQNPCRP